MNNQSQYLDLRKRIFEGTTWKFVGVLGIPFHTYIKNTDKFPKIPYSCSITGLYDQSMPNITRKQNISGLPQWKSKLINITAFISI